MGTSKKSQDEVGAAFITDLPAGHIPEDAIGVVWVNNRTDRKGLKSYRGTLDFFNLPMPTSHGKIHVILFPFKTGSDQYGISIQLSRKHHKDRI